MLSTSLRYFHAVARAGSIREASETLHVAQSALSRRLQNLEAEMNVTLFERSRAGVRLTSAGEVLLHHVREVTRQNERMSADMEAVRGIKRGHVVARVIEAFAASLLPQVLTTYRQYHPAVTLDIMVARSGGIIEAVLDGSCHFGVAFGQVRDPRLAVLASMPEPLEAIMSPSHPLAGEKLLTLQQLLAYPLATPSRRGGSRLLLEAALATEKLACQPVLETNSMDVAAAFCRGGSGIAITSPHRAAPYIKVGELVSIALAAPALSHGRFELLARQRQRLPPAAEALARAVTVALEDGRSANWNGRPSDPLAGKP